MLLSSPNKPLASPLCSSVWQKYLRDISYHLRKLCLHYTYFFSLKCLIGCYSFITFGLNGIEASEVEHVFSLTAAFTKLGLDCWFCPPSVCWFAFVYILTSVL